MSASLFDKVLKIVGIVVNILQVALRALTSLDLNDDDEKSDDSAKED